MKFKNGLNSQKMKYCKTKIVWNVLENMFEMFLKTIDWRLIWKFYVTITCGLHLIEHQD